MHENGIYKVTSGMIHMDDYINCMNNPAMIVDLSCGVILKIGDIYTSIIKDEFAMYINKLKNSSITLIEFDRYANTLTIDDICTLINYMQNHIGKEKINQLLSMNENDLKKEIEKYKSYEF